jgi:hypothetical protein
MWKQPKYTNEESVVCIHNGILFRHKKKWHAESLLQSGWVLKPSCYLKKPETEGQIMYDSIQKIYVEQTNS